MTANKSRTGKSSPAYYFYENWVAHGHSARIHYSHCGFCNNGRGIHQTDSTRCGQWHGPFDSLKEATLAAKDTGANVTKCLICRPQAPSEDAVPQYQQPASDSDTPEKQPAQKFIEAFRDAADQIAPPDISPLPIAPPEDPNYRAWLSAIMAEALQEDCAQSFIEEVRDETGLLDPLDSRELDDNRRVPHHKVARIVRALASEYDWPDHFVLVKYAFRPELLKSDIQAPPSEAEDLTPEDQLFAATMSEALYLLWVRAGFQQLFADIFTNAFTEYAISGELSPIIALPSWFIGNVFQIPFMETRLVISVATPLSNIKDQIRLLRSEFRNAYTTGHRGRQPENPERDAWIVSQYQHIKSTLPEHQEYDRRMAEILELEDQDIHEATALDELLNRFGESDWGHELTRYDLSTPQDRRKAKNFLKQILHRQRIYLRNTLHPLPPSFSDA